MVEKEYIEREAALDFNFSITVSQDSRTQVYDVVHSTVKAIAAHIEDIPAADVVEVQQIRAFIDKLIAKRDKYDLHSMRWEYYNCDCLLIEQMLDEITYGEHKGGDE